MALRSRSFRFGVQIARPRPAQEWRDTARRAEALGYDIFLMPDHFGRQFAIGPALAVVAEATTTLQIGTTDEVRLRPKSAVVARLMGQGNVFDAVVEGERQIRCGDRMLSVASTHGFNIAARVTALIPPDFISLTGDEARSINAVKGILTDVKPLGDMTSLALSFADKPLRFRITAREAASRNMHVGDALTVDVDGAGIHLMRE